MTRMRAIYSSVAVAALAGLGAVVAQERNTDKPAPGVATDLKMQCENAIKSKDYLKELKLTIKDEGGKISCEGTVPSKVHACAVFLTCMSVNGCQQCDVSRLKIEHAGIGAGDASKTLPKDGQGGGDSKGHLDRGGFDKGTTDK